MKQLNLFEFDEELDGEPLSEQPINKNEGINKIERLVDKKSSVPKDLFEMSLKEGTNYDLTEEQPSTFNLHDKVKIILIDEAVDSETHNYRKYYEAHLIGKIGEITKIIHSSKGKISYEVQVYGEKSVFESSELIWIG